MEKNKQITAHQLFMPQLFNQNFSGLLAQQLPNGIKTKQKKQTEKYDETQSFTDSKQNRLKQKSIPRGPPH